MRTNFGGWTESTFAFGVCVGFGFGVGVGFGFALGLTLCFVFATTVGFKFGDGLCAGVAEGVAVVDVVRGPAVGVGFGVGFAVPGIAIMNGPSLGSALAEFRNALRPFQLSANAVNAATMSAKATNNSDERRDQPRTKLLNTRTRY